MMTKRELLKYGIKPDDECCFCGESIDHTFIHCFFTKSFIQTEFIRWFNTTSNSQISQTMEERLFRSTTNEFKFITLSMRYFIYSRELNNKPIHLHDIVNGVQQET